MKKLVVLAVGLVLTNYTGCAYVFDTGTYSDCNGAIGSCEFINAREADRVRVV